ncbi:MAG: hypothetical protein DIKNOCCD_03300 [bacterium]|nr:hypothetical protein [bacterium]
MGSFEHPDNWIEHDHGSIFFTEDFPLDFFRAFDCLPIGDCFLKRIVNGSRFTHQRGQPDSIPGELVIQNQGLAIGLLDMSFCERGNKLVLIPLTSSFSGKQHIVTGCDLSTKAHLLAVFEFGCPQGSDIIGWTGLGALKGN